MGWLWEDRTLCLWVRKNEAANSVPSCSLTSSLMRKLQGKFKTWPKWRSNELSAATNLLARCHFIPSCFLTSWAPCVFIHPNILISCQELRLAKIVCICFSSSSKMETYFYHLNIKLVQHELLLCFSECISQSSHVKVDLHKIKCLQLTLFVMLL